MVTRNLDMKEKLNRLKGYLRNNSPLLIAYSGGVDSSYLLAVAYETLGNQMLAIIADSPSLPRQALAAALELAGKIGAPIEVIKTQEMEDQNYTSNPINRCYFCKAELFSKLNELARKRKFAAIAYGENADDAHHFRPGMRAAMEFSIISPLKFVGLDKNEIRELSRELKLPTADAPAQPCLSSRIPHGTPVTEEVLAMVERAEEIVRSLGFKVFRVRHIVAEAWATARVQIAPEEMKNISSLTGSLISGLTELGYQSIEIDPAGYRTAP